MRFAFVAFAVFCSLTFVAAQTVSTDPILGAPKLAVTKAAPPPTSVNVLNFPETQGVSGTVSVDNLPAVQTVGGTVNVGNLPLDAEGAVRIAAGCPTAPPPQARYVDLLGGGTLTIPGESNFLSEAISTVGYSHVGILVADIASPPPAGTYVEWSWVNDSDWFATITDQRNGNYSSQCENTWGSQRLLCVVSGSWIRLRVFNQQSASRTILALGVYLMP